VDFKFKSNSQAREVWRAWEQATMFGLARALTSHFISVVDQADELLAELRQRQLQRGVDEWYPPVQVFHAPDGSTVGGLPVVAMWEEMYTNLLNVRSLKNANKHNKHLKKLYD
jgi:hypothetical protein